MKSGNVQSTRNQPARNRFVKYRLNDADDWKFAKILSKQPKKGGKYGNWINYKIEGEKADCMDWNLVAESQYIPYPERVLLLTQEEEYSQVVVNAKNRELEKLKENNVTQKVPLRVE